MIDKHDIDGEHLFYLYQRLCQLNVGLNGNFSVSSTFELCNIGTPNLMSYFKIVLAYTKAVSTSQNGHSTFD